jgi:2-iminoacetate synthase
VSFLSVYNRYSWDEVTALIASRTASHVEAALSKPGRGSIEEFAALISPAAQPYLEQMAQLSHALTVKRFGHTMQMYAPLYLSNECQNICTYCGFSFTNKIERLTLTNQQISAEADAVKALGFDHLLVVTGEAPKKVGMAYFKDALSLLTPKFSQVSFEVQPLEEDEYRELRAAGVTAVLVYQETYHRETYKTHHPKGKKSNLEYRLETPDRLGRAGIHKIGLGALLGLEDWRADSFFTALHLAYLERAYWRTKYSISFPRLRPAEGVLEPKVVVEDKDLVQLICAYRIFNENVELSLSTRESAWFRDHAVKLGVTTMSAGSRTDPGGYSTHKSALRQFEISDERPPAEVAEMLKAKEIEPLWKDWESVYSAVPLAAAGM